MQNNRNKMHFNERKTVDPSKLCKDVCQCFVMGSTLSATEKVLCNVMKLFFLVL